MQCRHVNNLHCLCVDDAFVAVGLDDVKIALRNTSDLRMREDYFYNIRMYTQPCLLQHSEVSSEVQENFRHVYAEMNSDLVQETSRVCVGIVLC